MKIFKFAIIALIAASSFSNADAQIIVKAKIGSGPVYHRPVRRPVRHRRVYHRRRVIVREPVHHYRPVRHYHH